MRVLRISHSAVVDAWRERERVLRRLGVDVRLLSARRWDEGGRVVPLEPRPGEDVVGIRTFGTHPALFVADPVALWRELGADVDVLDVHEEPYSLVVAQVLATRRLRRLLTRRPRRLAPYVLYSAQNIAKRYPPPFRWLEQWALRHAAAVSAPNVETARIVLDKGLRGRAEVIPLGIDSETFSPGSAAGARSAGSVVGYAGRLEDYKGVLVLLEAVAGAPGLELEIAGDGPLRPQVEEAVAAGGGRIRYRGSLSGTALADFYRGVDVLAVPSLVRPNWIEQFGRVVVEAMACGTPVVATATGALPEVVGDAGLLVPPDDAAALRDALLRVTTDAGLAARLREAGTARAATCTWESVADQYLAMYRDAIGAAGPAATAPGAAHGGEPGAGPGGEPGADEAADAGLEVVVVAYRRPDLVANALAALGGRYPVLVVDNSSLPEIREVAQAAGARYVDPGRNGGFAAGVNRALADRLDTGADILLLNPDATIDPDSVERLRAALHADARLAAVGPRQVGGDGHPARVAWPFPTPGRAWLEAVGLGRVRAEDAFVIGSVLLLRARALRDVGPFDERFFLYSEETDWQRRAVRRGWRSAVVPDAVATHLGGATSTDGHQQTVHFHASQERYFRKHYGPVGWQLARAAQIAGATARGTVLPGERGAAARSRALLYVRGPVQQERRGVEVGA